MSNTITFPTLAALTAHAATAFRIYAGPFPEWADTTRKCASVFAKRAAFGLTGMSRYELEDTTENRALLDSMGKKLHAAAVARAEENAQQAVDWQRGPDYVSIEEHTTAMQESGQWPADEDSEHWHFAAIRELTYAALTQK